MNGWINLRANVRLLSVPLLLLFQPSADFICFENMCLTMSSLALSTLILINLPPLAAGAATGQYRALLLEWNPVRRVFGYIAHIHLGCGERRITSQCSMDTHYRSVTLRNCKNTCNLSIIDDRTHRLSALYDFVKFLSQSKQQMLASSCNAYVYYSWLLRLDFIHITASKISSNHYVLLDGICNSI